MINHLSASLARLCGPTAQVKLMAEGAVVHLPRLAAPGATHGDELGLGERGEGDLAIARRGPVRVAWGVGGLVVAHGSPSNASASPTDCTIPATPPLA
jgi:hypothetical protein